MHVQDVELSVALECFYEGNLLVLLVLKPPFIIMFIDRIYMLLLDMMVQ